MLHGVTGDVLLPPAERPAGARGVRGLVAASATRGGVIALALGSVADEPGWTDLVEIAAGLGLLGTALLLWTARRAAALGAAAVLIALSIGGVVVARDAQSDAAHERDKWLGASFQFDAKGRRLSLAEAEAIPMGTTRSELIAELGPPAGRGVQRVADEPDLRCLAYRGLRGHGLDAALYAFCFDDGRLVALRRW
jgi:hypothetical protein